VGTPQAKRQQAKDEEANKSDEGMARWSHAFDASEVATLLSGSGSVTALLARSPSVALDRRDTVRRSISKVGGTIVGSDKERLLTQPDETLPNTSNALLTVEAALNGGLSNLPVAGAGAGASSHHTTAPLSPFTTAYLVSLSLTQLVKATTTHAVGTVYGSAAHDARHDAALERVALGGRAGQLERTRAAQRRDFIRAASALAASRAVAEGRGLDDGAAISQALEARLNATALAAAALQLRSERVSPTIAERAAVADLVPLAGLARALSDDAARGWTVADERALVAAVAAETGKGGETATELASERLWDAVGRRLKRDGRACAVRWLRLLWRPDTLPPHAAASSSSSSVKRRRASDNDAPTAKRRHRRLSSLRPPPTSKLTLLTREVDVYAGEAEDARRWLLDTLTPTLTESSPSPPHLAILMSVGTGVTGLVRHVVTTKRVTIGRRSGSEEGARSDDARFVDVSACVAAVGRSARSVSHQALRLIATPATSSTVTWNVVNVGSKAVVINGVTVDAGDSAGPLGDRALLDLGACSLIFRTAGAPLGQQDA